MNVFSSPLLLAEAIREEIEDIVTLYPVGHIPWDFTLNEWNAYLKKNTDELGNHLFRGRIVYHDGSERLTIHREYASAKGES